MRHGSRLGSLLLVAVVGMIGSTLYWGTGEAKARPNYLKEFKAKYTKVEKANCTICHPAKNNPKKKIRNVYGKALQKSLGATKVKDVEKIKEGLKKTESKKSKVEGKTFGDLLKEGKRPAGDS